MLLATRRMVEDQWLLPARDVAEAQDLAFALDDRSAQDAVPGANAVVRAADTGLPWSISVSASGDAPRGGFAARRQLLTAGVLVLACMTMAASTLTVRAVKKEMSIARLQSDFVAAVSHEFRTPLTSLRQFTDMLREGRVPDEERRHVCYEAQARATARLSRLVESLLDFGRMEAGEHRYRFDEVDVSAFVQAAVADFRQHLEGSGRALSVQAGPPMLVRADEESLSRALWNLLENAVKYSSESCAIHVVVRREQDQVCIDVRDNGIGIPDHEQHTIFDKFRRGEEAVRRGIKGTGLGLAMVREIMRAHGGHVGVVSSGTGSIFTLTLPARG
jgi:signal transduction histidine kinase